MREEIIRLGGEFLFNEKVIDFEIKDRKVEKVITDKREIKANVVVLSIGHSARDTFYKLFQRKRYESFPIAQSQILKGIIN